MPRTIGLLCLGALLLAACSTTSGLSVHVWSVSRTGLLAPTIHIQVTIGNPFPYSGEIPRVSAELSVASGSYAPRSRSCPLDIAQDLSMSHSCSLIFDLPESDQGTDIFPATLYLTVEEVGEREYVESGFVVIGGTSE